MAISHRLTRTIGLFMGLAYVTSIFFNASAFRSLPRKDDRYNSTDRDRRGLKGSIINPSIFIQPLYKNLIRLHCLLEGFINFFSSNRAAECTV